MRLVTRWDLLSGVDYVDVVFAGVVPVTPEELNEYSVLDTLDMFRYSATSLPLPDLTPGGTPYFSLDGGATSLAPFATGEYHGDGWQAGHWQGGQGIMDPSLPDNEIHNLTPLDLRAMDVIGWDLAISADFDLDMDVDSDDFLAWQSGFGMQSGAIHAQGDADRDGDCRWRRFSCLATTIQRKSECLTCLDRSSQAGDIDHAANWDGDHGNRRSNACV